MKILLVEDNETNMTVLAMFMKVLGYECDYAITGAEAIDLFQRNTYDLIFMDCQMPGMDGYEACEKIRFIERASGKKMTPIVALTAHALPQDKIRCENAGMNGYLTKPVTVAEMNEVLKSWTKNNQAE